MDKQLKGLKVAILVETDNNDFFPNRGALVDALRQALATHANDAAYLKIGGKPAYARARAGEEVELEPRKITISDLSIRHPELVSGSIFGRGCIGLRNGC